MKGGGDAVSAVRAVLQTGEYHYALNASIEDDILTRLEAKGNGKVELTAGGDLEMIQLNLSESRIEVDGERSVADRPHRILSDPKVREALGLLIDREAIQQYILWPHRHRDGELPQQPAALRLARQYDAP